MHASSPQNARRPRPVIVRRRVNGEDFNLFAAIVGSQPILPPEDAERAAVEEMNATPTREPPTILKAAIERAASHRLPSADSILTEFRRLCYRGIAARMKRPDMAQWVRHVSDSAIRRIEEAQLRLSAPGGRQVTAREPPLKKVA